MTWRTLPWQQFVTTAEWAAAITDPTRTVSGRVVVIDPTGTELTDVPVTSCTVDFDGEKAERSAMDFTVADRALVPTNPESPLDPRAGNRVRVYWRLWADGVWLEVPLGTFWVDDPAVDDDGAGIGLRLSGHDAVAHYRRGGYGGRVLDVSGHTVTDALTEIFETLQIADYTVAASTAGLPSTFALGENDDPWDDVTGIAEMAGFSVWADRHGVIVADKDPEPQATKFDWQEGPTSPVVALKRGITTSSIRNRVVATSTSPDVDPPVTAVVQDDDPSSPTWVGRPGFGIRETRIKSDKIADVEGARNMAAATLARWARATETVTVQARQRPDLAYRDLAALASPRSGVNGLWRVRGWRLNLPVAGADPMTVTTQTRTMT